MARVISALILRDMRTRFGRQLFGWAIMILWPLTHLGFIVGGYLIAHRIAPYGTNVTIFIGTGVLPYILCLYPARMIMLCLVQNQPLLLFPPVMPIDIILARSILEITNAFYVIFFFCLILFVFDVDFIPGDYPEAIFAILTTIYLGFSIGFISAILFKISRAWVPIQIGLLIGAYLTSGAIVPLTNLSPTLKWWLWFNPLVHTVEWLRYAYFGQSSADLLSREYLLSYATFILFLSLALEKFTRPLLLNQN